MVKLYFVPFFNKWRSPLTVHQGIRRPGFYSPFFLSSGLPFLTVAITMSPTPAAGSLFSRPLIPFTEMIYRFLAPLRGYKNELFGEPIRQFCHQNISPTLPKPLRLSRCSQTQAVSSLQGETPCHTTD